MTPKQALESLVQAAQQARLTYQEHVMLDQCAAILRTMITEQNGTVDCGTCPQPANRVATTEIKV